MNHYLTKCCFSLSLWLVTLLLEFLETEIVIEVKAVVHPKWVPVISKGSAEILQVSTWNDLLVGEASS